MALYQSTLWLRRGAAPAVASAPPQTTREPLPPLARLQPDPELTRRAAPAAVVVDSGAPTRLAIELRGNVGQLDPEAAGVAVFAADTGADFQWLPLRSKGPDGLLAVEVRATGPLVLTLAADRHAAAHGYLARLEGAFPRTHGQRTAVVFEVALASVEFQLAAPKSSAGPLQLVRVDDPSWVPSGPAAAGISLTGGTAVHTVLGRGDYALRDPLEPTHEQRFSVPAAGPVRVSGSLARSAAGRP